MHRQPPRLCMLLLLSRIVCPVRECLCWRALSPSQGGERAWRSFEASWNVHRVQQNDSQSRRRGRTGGLGRRERSTSTHQSSDSMTCVHIDSGRFHRDPVALGVSLGSPVLGLLEALLRIGRGTGQGRPAPGFGAKSSYWHPTQHMRAHRFGTIPPGSRMSDGVSNELYLPFIGGTPEDRSRHRARSTSTRFWRKVATLAPDPAQVSTSLWDDSSRISHG